MSETNKPENDQEKKVEDVAEEPKAEAPRPKPTPKPRQQKAEPKAEPKEESTDDRVALYVDHPIHWIGVGRLGKGINLLPKADAKVWTDAKRARQLSAEEVAEFYKA